jgi:NAD(P)-dependent dehydrogenase (short-subunit alcohol dehydrogenase family)
MKGKVVVITGAFGALGAVVAQVFAHRGARTILIDKAENSRAALRTSVGAGAIFMGGVDIADQKAATRAIESIQEAAGRVDVLVNIAGGFRWQTVREGESATWDLLYRLNLKTAVNMCRAVIPILTKGGHGRIINVGAGAAIKAAAGMGAYGASKAGVHRLTEALAEELKGQATVNAVLPSIIDTPQNRVDMADADFSTWVKPTELAAVIAFLASEESGAVTGALLPVNGRV